MIKKTLCLAVLALSLSACIEVKDDSNNDVVAALKEQNKILQQQISQTQKDPKVLMRGQVVKALNSTAVTSATIKVTAGSKTLVENYTANEGKFELADLPPNTDIEVLVSSADKEFVPRAFVMKTRATSAGQASYDVGYLRVSEPINVDISVLNSQNNQPVTGLQFKGYSSSPSEIRSSFIEQYVHKSTFNQSTGMYQITLPRHLTVNLQASLDLNADGKAEWKVEGSGSPTLAVRGANSGNVSTIYLVENKDAMPTSATLRVSVLDAQGQSLKKALLTFENTQGQKVTSTYDQSSQQHVLAIAYHDNAQINLPAFSENGASYSSGYIRMWKKNNTNLVYFSSSSLWHQFNYDVPAAEVYHLVAKPQVIQKNTPLVLVSKQFFEANNSYQVYYSEPVLLDEKQTTLVNKSSVKVIRGNDSDTDIVLPGTTTIGLSKSQQALSLVADLGNTRYTLKPSAPLIGNHKYEYNIAELTVESNSEKVDLSADNHSFTAKIDSGQTFNINEVVLDNFNYYRSGQLITPTNTAGQTSTRSNNRNEATLIFPSNVTALKHFEMNVVSVTEGGKPRSEFQRHVIVEKGRQSYWTPTYLLKAADNETIVTDGVNYYRRGSELSDGYYYVKGISIYIGDDQPGNTHSITFEYAYETADGTVKNGTLTLPVK